MEKFNIKGNVMILITTMIWGTAFVAQKAAMDAGVGPFTFISVRFFIGGCVTMLAAPLFTRGIGFRVLFNVGTVKAGIICGFVLFAGGSLQQVGMQYTTAGKAGFLTALYVVFVPLAALFLRRKPRIWVWPGMVLAVTGTYFLCVTEGFSINPGDAYIILSAVFFAGHILVIDRFAPGHDGIALSSVQFFTVSAVAAVFMLTTETPSISMIMTGALPILYTGVMSSGVAYTLQVKAQKITAPAVAAILFSMESVFAALADYLINRQGFSERELIGCVLVLSAVVVSQLPDYKIK